MKFYTDHYFHIGHTHLNSGKPCQDYAMSGIYKDMSYSIVSDGCSTGGNTDIGSRIISISTISILKDYWLINKTFDNINLEINYRQKIALSNAKSNLDLKSNDLFATCNYVCLSNNNYNGFIHTLGDGVIIIKYIDNNIKIIRLDWQNNMPFYPEYKEFELEKFISVHGNDLNAEVLNKEIWYFNLGNNNWENENRKLTLQEGIAGHFCFIDNLTNIDFIAVFSDGITQIENCAWKKEIINFTAFKSLTGEFLKRRMINAIKETKKVGNGPLDDIACAVIRINHEEE